MTREDDGRWRLSFSGNEPGRWTIWCDLHPGYAPVVLEDVDLPAANADLGRFRLGRGSRVSLRRHGSAGGEPDLLMVRVESIDGPPLERSLAGEGTVEVTGLRRGRYRLRGGCYRPETDEFPADIDEEIVLDGRTDVERTFDAGR